ncbi:MAG: hypothetical protein HZA78_02470 [Candidatus Schekmanbacteria bacterium]|nr:hypothetical protein [Candidatus Schekmanbacteria bacterium]
MGKLKNNLITAGFLVGLFLLPNLAQAALAPGQEVFFINMMPQISGGPLVYDINFSLINSDFIPELEGGEVIKMTSASWAVFVADYSPNTSLRASIEGEFLGTVNLDDLPPGSGAWGVDMSEAAYRKLEDFNGLVRVEVLTGNLGYVDSAVAGTGVVGGVPEPLSLLLLSGGIIGLGGKKFFRKN